MLNPFNIKFYVPRLGQALHPLIPIPIDVKYIGCLTQVYFMKISVISKPLTECNIGTTFSISYMSPTYITKKLVRLSPIFLHTHMVHLYLIKSNILTVASIIEVPTPHKLSIKVFALLLETTSLDGVCQ